MIGVGAVSGVNGCTWPSFSLSYQNGTAVSINMFCNLSAVETNNYITRCTDYKPF